MYHSRGSPTLGLTLIAGATLAFWALRSQERQEPRTTPSPWQGAEPELHFDDRPRLPVRSGAPSATPADTEHFTATSGVLQHARTDVPPPAATAEPVLKLGRQRWVQLRRLQARMGAGLCADADGASEAQDRLRAQFRALDWGDTARVYVDPRLPRSADAPLLQELEQAEREVASALGVMPLRPDVFAYFDQELLQNKSCADESLNAFYDGALHAVVTQRGMLQRLLRQYARHALVSRGLVGPSWAREGIALEIAGERGWQEPSLLARVASTATDLDALEHELPDIESASQAQLFHARAAAMVSCALRQRSDGLPGLITELEVTQARGELSYRLPASAEPTQLRSCLAALSH